MSAPLGPHVLISSAGRRVSLVRAFQKAASRDGGKVFACDMKRLAPALHASDGAFLVPPCTDPSFVPSVLDICVSHGISCVVPTIDHELPNYASARAQFADAGVTVMVSSPESVRIGLDKVETHQWLEDAGIPTVRQASLEGAKVSEWNFPVVAKPRRGSASIGFMRLDSAVELKQIADSNLIVQEFARGVEFTIDVLVSAQGRCVAAVPRRRLEVRAGEVSKAVTARSSVLERLGRVVGEGLPGAYGALNVQVFFDEPTGGLQVIEINPRFGGGYPLTHEAGADFTAWILDEVAGRRPPPALAWEAGLTMLRFDEAVFVRTGELP